MICKSHIKNKHGRKSSILKKHPELKQKFEKTFVRFMVAWIIIVLIHSQETIKTQLKWLEF